MMSEPSGDQERMLQQLSALADGECEPGQLQATCDVWRRDGRLRASWHTYALIGDVMRSDDLASPAAHDAQFLQTLRARLAQEPVVLAPAVAVSAPVALPARQLLVAGGAAHGSARVGRRRWAAPAAMAAGFVVVTGAMVMMRTTVPEAGASLLAGNGSGNGSSLVQTGASIETTVVDSEAEMVRNPELDRYLNAHRQFTQGASLAGPGGVRQVAVTPGGR